MEMIMELLHYAWEALVTAGVILGIPWLLAGALGRLCASARQDNASREG